MIANEPQRHRQLRAEHSGPAAPAHRIDDVIQRQARRRPHRFLGAQQPAQRHLAGGQSGLEQRHRPHVDARHPACAGVPRHVVGWRGGTGEDESARPAAVVARPSEVVPDLRGDLPFVEQARLGALDQAPGLDACKLDRIGVGVEQHFAGGSLPGRCRLAAGAHSFHDHAGRRAEPLRQQTVHDPAPVRGSTYGVFCVRHPASPAVWPLQAAGRPVLASVPLSDSAIRNDLIH